MNIVEQLRRDEGEKLSAYRDSEGYWTIGIGVLIDARKGGSITEEESAMLFTNRLSIKQRELMDRLPWSVGLDEARRGVLLNMSYQLGVGGLLNFKKTLGLISSGKYEEAGIEMLNSTWAKQTPQRAARLSKQMITGVWQ